jgi:hypothetical protein
MSAKFTTDQDDVAINGALRYRALLKTSGTVGAQPTVDAALHSLATLLSNVVSFDRIALLFPTAPTTAAAVELRQTCRTIS